MEEYKGSNYTTENKSHYNAGNRSNYTTELFYDKDTAEKAYQEAIDQGYSDKDISVLMSEDSRKKYYDSVLVEKVPGNDAVEGAGVGGMIGAAVGGTLGALAALGTSLVIPGLGLIIAGPIAAGLAGAGAGGLSGGLIGALVGWGIPEDKARIYEDGIKSGGIVLAVDDKRPDSTLGSKWQKYRA
jgi:hypothetical protein